MGIYDKNPDVGFDTVVNLHEVGYDKLEFVIYDFLRFTPDKVNMAERLLNTGIDRRLIGRQDVLSCIYKKMSVRDLRTAYDFKSPYFDSMIIYMIDNHKDFGYTSVLEITESFVKAGINKNAVKTAMGQM